MTRNERFLVVGQGLLLGGSAIAGVALSDSEDWQLGLFALLLTVAVVSSIYELETKRFKVSAAFLSLVLAMTLLGPAPAACIAVLAVAYRSLARRSPWQSCLANLSTYAFFPLMGGGVFDVIGGPALLETNPATFFLLVFTVFMATNALNFLLLALDFKVFEGWPILGSLRELVPRFPATASICIWAAPESIRSV